MKSSIRQGLLCLLLAAPWSHAAAQDPSLIGCWRAVKIVLYAQDGSKMEDTSGRCMLQFKQDQLDSICSTSSGTATTTYRYGVVRPNVYLATMTASTFRTESIGSAREYEYRVDGDRLVTVNHPKAPAGGPAPVAMRVESEAVRASCP